MHHTWIHIYCLMLFFIIFLFFFSSLKNSTLNRLLYLLCWIDMFFLIDAHSTQIQDLETVQFFRNTFWGQQPNGLSGNNGISFLCWLVNSVDTLVLNWTLIFCMFTHVESFGTKAVCIGNPFFATHFEPVLFWLSKWGRHWNNSEKS